MARKTPTIAKGAARATPKPSTAKVLKRLHNKARKNGSELSLRQFAKSSEDTKVREVAENWLHNKKSDFSKPPLGLGRTRKKKKQ